MKYKEGRTNLFGYESAAGGRRREIKEKNNLRDVESDGVQDDNVSNDEKFSTERSDIERVRRGQDGIEVVNSI